jgi:hypothetical protein
MSELTQCNYCGLQQTKRHAKEKGMKVTLFPSRFMGGTDVFVHPKDVKIKDQQGEDREKYLSSWMMKIGDRCEC